VLELDAARRLGQFLLDNAKGYEARVLVCAGFLQQLEQLPDSRFMTFESTVLTFVAAVPRSPVLFC
jgi:hypothetical protein